MTDSATNNEIDHSPPAISNNEIFETNYEVVNFQLSNITKSPKELDLTLPYVHFKAAALAYPLLLLRL
jgi:hypothetical protein